MFNKSNRKFSKRKGSVYLLITILLFLFFFVSIFLNKGFKISNRGFVEPMDVENLYLLWEDKKYQEIIQICEKGLEDDFLNIDYLRFHGFANFYLGISQISLEMKIPLINQSIISLRRAFVIAEDNYKKDISYILGKAYYYKGSSYADLAIKYLDIALDKGYLRKDIYEFKGLAYYELGDYEASINEFESLPIEKHTPEVKYRISRAYDKIGEVNKQKQYLLEILNNPGEKQVKSNAYLDLANIYFLEKDYEKAISNSNEVLKSYVDNTEAQLIIGKSLFLTGNKIEAKKIFRKLLKQKPGDKEIISWLNK